MDTRTPARRMIALLAAGSFVAGTAFAGPPPWAGGGHRGGEEEHGHRSRHEEDRHVRREVVVVHQGAYFSDRHRQEVHRYYASHHCPPGLAKKHNGCLPPGHARQVWVVGQPLPPTVVITPVPQQVVVTLPPPPVGHRYVEVAGDILLIAAGSKMVVDGINGLASR